MVTTPKFALVLGMTNVEIIDDATPETQRRDHRRIKEVEKELSGYTLYSLEKNFLGSQKATALGAEMTRRGALKIVDELKGGVRFSYIMGDYFRFPASYMTEAYKEILAFIEVLRNNECLTKDVVIYLPSMIKKTGVDRAFEPLDFESEGYKTLVVSDLRENPLWRATEVLEKNGEESQKGYPHSSQTKYLEGFLRITLDDSASPSQAKKSASRTRRKSASTVSTKTSSSVSRGRRSKGVKKNTFIGPVFRDNTRCAHAGYLKKHAKSQLKACTTSMTCKRVKGVKGAHCENKKTRAQKPRLQLLV
jgi:hypothetical protein